MDAPPDMLQRAHVEVPGQPDAEIVLDRPATAGGSHADAVYLPPLPAGALELEPAELGIVVVATVAGARAAGHPLAPGTRRLLRPGERVELHGASVGPVGGVPVEGTRAIGAVLLAQAAAGGSPSAGPHLVVLTGPAAGVRLPLGAEETLGRGRGASLRLADPRASRRHALVRVAGGSVTIEDLGSKNGLRVNGVRADRGPQPLRPGDEVAIGETVLALADPLAPLEAPRGAPPMAAPRRTGGRDAAQVAAALLALAAAIAIAGL